MSPKLKTVLLRAARGLAATALAFLAGFLAGPEVLDLVPDPYDVLVTVVLIPTILSVEKALRWED